MASEIRVNSLSSRTGLSTVTFTDTGPIFSGITTFQDINVGTGGSIFSPASNTVTLGTNSAERVRIDSSGNMQVSTGQFTVGTTASTGLQLINDGTFGTIQSADLKIRTAATERLRITSAGLVGVNCTPLAQLQVKAGTNANIALTTMSSEAAIEAFNDAGSANVPLRLRGQDFKFYTSSTERLRITSAGNIGIDNTNPGEKLDVNGKIRSHHSSDSRFLLRVNSVNKGGFQATTDAGVVIYGASSTNPIKFQTSGSEQMRLTPGGDLLLGGQSAYTYDDTGASNTILDIWNSGNNKRGILSLSGNTNAGASIGTIWFNNENNSGASPGNTMKLSAAIQAQAVTSDGNAGNDAGARLQFLTKPEGSPMTDSMIISGEGYVTKPRQPSFRVGRNSNYNPGAGSDIIFNTVSGGGKHNVGNHYNASNGRFTAPVAGVYTFTAHVIWMNLSSGQNMADCFHPKINGVVQGYSGRRGEYISNTTGNGGYYADFMTYQFTLAAGDYVTINNQFNLTIHGNSNYTTFSGHLVG